MLVGGILVTACQKKNNIPPAPVSFKGYFRGKLNGTFFNDTVSGKILRSFSNITYISGYHPNGGITYSLKNFPVAVGDYPLGNDNLVSIGNSGGIFFAGYINGKIQGSGRISILEVTDSYIRGSFESIVPSDSSYAILPTLVVSDGEFKLQKP